MKIVVIALLLLFALLQYGLWMSKGGVVTVLQLRETIAAQQAQNKKLQARNDALMADINDLKSGNQAVEERARNELGMVKKGERFYQVVKQ